MPLLDFIRNITNNQIFNIPINFSFRSISEVVLIAVTMYAFHLKFIKGTQSERFVRGVFMLILAWVFSKVLIILNFQILGMFLESLISIIIVGLVVIFQPELRRFLVYLGQPGFFSKSLFHHEAPVSSVNVVDEITETVKYLSKTKTGGLMVIQGADTKASYNEVGTRLNADVSTELLLTIFHPNTALHDGAVIIHSNKILTAGALLPLTEDPKLSWKYGTRHRAAIGVSEAYNVVSVVVSEETGDVSIAKEGKLTKYEDIAEFKAALWHLLGCVDTNKSKKSNSKVDINNIFSSEIAKIINVKKDNVKTDF